MGKQKTKQQNGKKKMSKKTKIIVIICIISAFLIGAGVGAYALFAGDYFDNRTIEKFRKANVSQIDGGMEFEKLKALNPDITAWISVENTEINYPVFKTDNNNFYSSHNAEKKESSFGALYFDVNNQVFPSQTKNLVIYGQDCENGKMFGSLKNYQDPEYLRTHSIINLTTENGNQPYVVFAVYKTNAFAKDNNNYCFNFRPSTFSNTEAFTSWVSAINSRSIVNTGVKVTEKSKTLTLVTFGDTYADERLVVCARSVNSGETAIELAKNAKSNESAVYPAKWYEVKGIEMPKSAEKLFKAEQQRIAEVEKQTKK